MASVGNERYDTVAPNGNGVASEVDGAHPKVAGSVRLKFTGPVPVFVSPTFRAALLLPKHVGTLAKVLVMSAMPKFVGPTFGAALLLPKEVGALANNLVEALLRLGKHVSITPYGSRAPPRLTCILVGLCARARAESPDAVGGAAHSMLPDRVP